MLDQGFIAAEVAEDNALAIKSHFGLVEFERDKGLRCVVIRVSEDLNGWLLEFPFSKSRANTSHRTKLLN